MKKLHSFTLAELLVVMIISSIAVSSAYTIFLWTSDQFLKYRAGSENVRHFTLFANTIESDFNQCAEAVASENSLQLKFLNHAEVIYFLKKNEIVRKAFSTDTFRIEIIHFTINGQSAKTADKILVNDMRIKINLFGEPMTLGVFKNYGADVMIKYGY